jgi:hypothetical protein
MSRTKCELDLVLSRSFFRDFFFAVVVIEDGFVDDTAFHAVDAVDGVCFT